MRILSILSKRLLFLKCCLTLKVRLHVMVSLTLMTTWGMSYPATPLKKSHETERG